MLEGTKSVATGRIHKMLRW